MKNKEFFKLIKKSKIISILTHTSPDQDAVASGLLTLQFIKNNFSNRDVVFNIEGGIPTDYKFLSGSENISKETTLNFLKQKKPNLLIIVDANNFKKISKTDESKIKELIEKSPIKLAIIDHHPENYKDASDVYINNKSSSTSEEIYRIFTKNFGFKTSKEIAEIAIFGIIADTNRFLYTNKNHKETFKIVSELLDQGVTIEDLWNKIYVLQKNHAIVIAELLKNIQSQEDYNYSYISDDFVKNFSIKSEDWESFSDAFYIFIDQYIRYINGNTWGFAIIPDFSNDQGEYRGAFRASSGTVDTSVFARELGGGGHKSASGFSVTAKNYKEALEKIKEIIKRSKKIPRAE